MFRWIVALVLLLPIAASAQFAKFVAKGIGNELPAIVFNMSDYATCNGVVDDTAGIIAMNSAAKAWQAAPNTGLIQVNVSGKCCALGNTTSAPAAGLRKVQFVGTNQATTGFWVTCGATTGNGGITLGADAGASGGFGGGICQKGLTQPDGCSARLNAVTIGDTSVTLTTASCGAGYISRFPISGWVLVGGFDTQASGYPPNPFHIDIAKITNVVSCTITLDRTMTHNLKTTWPVYNAGSAGSTDNGGPATIWYLQDPWDTEVEYRNLTLYRNTSPMNATGKQIVFRNVTVGNDNCLSTSQNLVMRFFNVDAHTCFIEMDKIVKRVEMTDSSFLFIDFQSGGSFEHIEGTNVTIGTLAGSPLTANFTDSTFTTDFKPGAYAYGRSDSFTCTRCNIMTWPTLSYGGARTTDVETGFTMTAGVLSRTDGNLNSTNWNTPGGWVFWTDEGNVNAPEALAFQLLDTQFGPSGETQITTSLTGQTGFPTLPKGTPGVLGLLAHPSPAFTCINCFGSQRALDLSTPACHGKPLFSCTSTTYTGQLHGTANVTCGTPPVSCSYLGTAGDPQEYQTVWGQLGSITIAVAQAFTGTGGQLDFQLGPGYSIILPSGSTCVYNPTVNLSAAGTRVITPGASEGASVTGKQTGDGTLSIVGYCTPATNGWYHGTRGIYASADVSGQSSTVWPIVTVTTITNQNLP